MVYLKRVEIAAKSLKTLSRIGSKRVGIGSKSLKTWSRTIITFLCLKTWSRTIITILCLNYEQNF